MVSIINIKYSCIIGISLGYDPYLVGGLEHGLYFSHHIGNVIIPTDELIFFQRGWSTTNQL